MAIRHGNPIANYVRIKDQCGRIFCIQLLRDRPAQMAMSGCRSATGAGSRWILKIGGLLANPLTRKLENYAPLSGDDKRFLAEIARPGRHFNARADIIREGDRPDNVHLVTQGFACRYKILSDGKRHIMAYLVPGDLCDVHVFILEAMDHSIGTLSPCQVVDIPRERVLQMLERPAIARALYWAALVDEATLREWLVNIGRRPAEQRVAHLLCELLMRLQTVGLANSNSYELPITQTDVAETMGLTVVHVNRVIQRLRAGGLISLRNKQLVVNDAPKLREFSGFNPNYLHLRDMPKITERC